MGAWNGELYDNKLGFVSQYGQDVVELLNVEHGERILDLGCGTGDLTFSIKQRGAHVIGLDASSEMIKEAKAKYADIEFVVKDAKDFSFEVPFDAIFSNAALHWIKPAEAVIESVWHNLKPQGRFIAELGGKGNVQLVIDAIGEVLTGLHGIDANQLNPWYFPSIAEYSTLLESQGFRVVYASHFDRPTIMPDEEKGLTHWLKGFAWPFFQSMTSEDREYAYCKIIDKLKPSLYMDGAWHIDYKRLRIAAIKG